MFRPFSSKMMAPDDPDTGGAANPNQEPQPAKPTVSNPDTQGDDFSGKTHMVSEINRLRDKIAKQESAQRAADDASERKKLEEQEKYKELAALAQQERDDLAASFAAKERSLTLEAGFSGIENEYTRAGVIAKCPNDVNPEEYISHVRAESADLWASAEASQHTGGQGLRSSNNGNNTGWSKVKADMSSRNPALVDPAIAKYTEYISQHGQKPPGWD